jgi:hypothetical protein
VINSPLWQLFIVLLTAVLTTSLGYYWADRSQRKKEFLKSKAAIKGYGHLLAQAVSNFLQAQADADYYEARAKISKQDKMKLHWADAAKSMVVIQPQQSFEVVNVYAKIIEQLAIIEALANKEDFNRITVEAKDFIFKNRLTATKWGNDIESWKQAWDRINEIKQEISKTIDKQITKKFEDLVSQIDQVRLKLL